MKKVWCDLCGEQITDLTYVKVEANQVDSEHEEVQVIYYPNDVILNKPLEVHKECLIEAFSDFQKKKKLPEGSSVR